MTTTTTDPTNAAQQERRASWRGRGATTPASRPGSKKKILLLICAVLMALVAIRVYRNVPESSAPIDNVSDLAAVAGELKSDYSAQASRFDLLVTGIKEKDNEIAELKKERDGLKKKLEKFEQSAILFREAFAAPEE